MIIFRAPNIARLLLIFITFYFILTPIYDVVVAQNNQSSPVIVHLPIESAVQGQPISVVARAADRYSKVKVFLNFEKDGNYLDEPLPMVRTFEDQVMKIKVVSGEAGAYSGPTSWSDTLAIVLRDEIYETYEAKNDLGFYHIKLDDETDAWLSFKDAEALLTGAKYRGTIPAEMTFAPTITYYLLAENEFHQKTTTEPYTVHIISLDEQLAANQQGQKKTLKRDDMDSKRKGSFLKSKWFLGGLVVVGAGTAAILATSKEKKEKGTISIEIEW